MTSSSSKSFAATRATLVIWSKCDRLLFKGNMTIQGGAKGAGGDPASEPAAKRPYLADSTIGFLDEADDRERNISITVNGEQVKPWKPFLS